MAVDLSQYTISPKTIGRILLATILCVFLPYKLAHDYDFKSLYTIVQPIHLICREAPVHPDWSDAAAGADKDLLADRKLVQQYIDVTRCLREAESAEASDSPDTHGIVIVSGGVAMLSNSLAVITVLRETLHSVLPIQVVYFGKEEYDEELVAQLQTFSNVTCLNAEDVPQPKHHAPTDLKGTHYELKAFILAYVTTFNKVLLLDADNFPLAKPEALFTAMSRDSSNAFEQHGSLFWPDWGQKQNDNLLAGFDVNPLAYTTFDLPVPWGNITEPMRFTESGQMLFDRARHADVLEWLWFLNSHQNPIYGWMWFDKDTYRLAFGLANKSDDFQMVSTDPRIALDYDAAADPPFRHAGMLQHDLAGDLQFLHRTAGGKFDPTTHEPWRTMHFASNPLTAQQARLYFPGLTLSSAQVTTKYEAHCCTRQASAMNPAMGCNLKLCNTSGDPLPVLAVSLDSLDHGVRAIINQQDVLFAAIRANITTKSAGHQQ